MLPFNHINLEGINGRMFVVGDIHGHFSLLEQRLNELAFNREHDCLFSVGDLVDRGPESHLAVNYILQPWFYAVMGNHELMTLDAGGTSWHTRNGGEWYNQMIEDEGPERAVRFGKMLGSLPLIIEAITPSGRKVGFCHASFPATKFDSEMHLTDWNDAPRLATKTNWPFDENPILWDRDQIRRAMNIMQRAPEYRSERKMREFNVENVDHVYFGHTPLKEPLTVGKMTWLDTGAFATGNLTVLEIE